MRTTHSFPTPFLHVLWFNPSWQLKYYTVACSLTPPPGWAGELGRKGKPCLVG